MEGKPPEPDFEELLADARARLQALPSEGAWIELELSNNHDGRLTVLGNAAGLARLGTILVKCASDTAEAREYRMLGPAAGDLRRLAPDTPAEVVLEAIELRQERPTHAERKTTWRDRLALLGCGLVAAVVGIIFLAGLADVLGLITGK